MTVAITVAVVAAVAATWIKDKVNQSSQCEAIRALLVVRRGEIEERICRLTSRSLGIYATSQKTIVVCSITHRWALKRNLEHVDPNILLNILPDYVGGTGLLQICQKFIWM